jgi:lysophospholipase L1-like esterase
MSTDADGTGDGAIVVATLGDSISAGNPGWDPNPALREREGDDPESQYQHWAALRDSRLRFRNHGVGGEVTAEIAARFEQAVDGADVLVVQGGINDVVHGLPPAQAAEHLRSMVERAQGLGLGVLITDVLPWNRGWPEAEPTIRELNALIGGLASATGIDVLAFHDTLEDPERPGRMLPEWTADGNHPSVAGHRRLGEIAFHLPRGWELTR